jgi:hypothetical protein
VSEGAVSAIVPILRDFAPFNHDDELRRLAMLLLEASAPVTAPSAPMHIAIENRRYVLEEDGTLRKTAPSPIMDGAEEAAVREVARLRVEWSKNMQRYHAINNREIPALNRRIREAVRDTLSGYFTVRQLEYITGPTFGASWDGGLRDVAVAASLHDDVAAYDDLLAESSALFNLTRDFPCLPTSPAASPAGSSAAPPTPSSARSVER